ncbi:hypothetical protein AVEN_242301-1 [Araneus ventricosus]|uniref:Uncharacterized protein n=1 Tax=Araneus ventricosus TaxID=182803 RepID=A0A4Y2U339_ARAVE|nr:hypothetical protein AVEN_242301-1 [Araneus ventricosus]
MIGRVADGMSQGPPRESNTVDWEIPNRWPFARVLVLGLPSAKRIAFSSLSGASSFVLDSSSSSRETTSLMKSSVHTCENRMNACARNVPCTSTERRALYIWQLNTRGACRPVQRLNTHPSYCLGNLFANADFQRDYCSRDLSSQSHN